MSNFSIQQSKIGKSQRKLKKRLSPGKVLEVIDSSSSKDICSCSRLRNELLLFVDDFIDSQEYQDYLDFKRSVLRKDQAVQYDTVDLRKDGAVDTLLPKKKKRVDMLTALSRKALRVFSLDVQIEKYLDNMKNSQILMKQEEAIFIIRQKIAEVKCAFIRHQEEILNRRKERQCLVEKFINRHNIDISKLMSTKRLKQVILDIERKLRMKKRSHKNNIKVIVEKLLKEYHQDKNNEVKKMKRLNSIKKNIGNENRVTHIKGGRGSHYMISSVHIQQKEDAVRKAFKDAGLCMKEGKFEISERLNIWNNNCATEISYTESDKTIQKNLMEELPQEDNMYKMKLNENAKNKLGVIESFVQFENLLEARHFFCTCERERLDVEKAEINYPEDEAMISNPDRIMFKDFTPGRIYSKILTLRNISRHPVRIRFFRVHCRKPNHTIHFEVDLEEIKIARPGLPVSITVKFQPGLETNVILGTMVFLTFCESTHRRYMIPIECLPAISDVKIEPRNVNFGTIPIWEFLKNPPEVCRFIKLTFRGTRALKIIINKVQDPFELDTQQPTEFIPVESPSSSEDSFVDGVIHKKTPINLEVEGIDEDNLMEIDNIFRFDRRCLVMDSHRGEEKLKITLSMIKNPGFYYEKYRFDIYDAHHDSDDFLSMQEIVITLDVSDYFIKCDPVCVDLGICLYGTAYQGTFGITNTSKATQSLSVKIPSLLSYYVSLNENRLIIKPGEIRRVAVKLLPSLDFTLEKNKYFDQETYILHFPIEVRLMNKKYASVPPIFEHCYAIINDCTDLLLDPCREQCENIDGKMVLDIGECSVSETVATQIVLRNTSYSRRYYGFTNLPQWITIMPNYGFGSINAFQEVTLDISIHPQLKDFKGPIGSSQDEFRAEKHLTISAETVANLGEYRRKPNMNRLLRLMRLMLAEIRNTTDLDQLEDIFTAKSSIRTAIHMGSLGTSSKPRRMSPTITLVEPEEAIDANPNKSSTNGPSTESGLTPAPLDNEAINKEQLSLMDHGLMDHSVNPVENLSRELRLKMVFVRPLYEFSFNRIEFPATPVGSYSLMTTELRPFKFERLGCHCSSRKEGSNLRCRATFKISGSTQDTRIVPMYGVLEHGQSINLTLISTPKISDDIIAAFAYAEKKNALYNAKLEYELRRREEAFANEKKSKTKTTVNMKKKKKKDKNISTEAEINRVVKEEDINIEISPEEVILDDSDYYPAELALWRSIEPHFLNTSLVCRLDYEMNDPWSHSPDILSLETVCKVVRPDFTHDQKTKHLDFGHVSIGDHERKIITIQNLKCHDITVATSILRPEGGFFCPNFNSVKLSGECFLKIPITYTPSRDESVLEYMEIMAEKTVYHFMLSAKASIPNVRLEPSSKIIRVISRKGKILDIYFEILNDSDQSVRVSLEKVCELEGMIPPQSSRRNSMNKSNPKKLGKKTENKDKKGNNNMDISISTNKRQSWLSYSDELTEEEIYSIENDFSSTRESPFFRLSEEDTELTLQGNSKKSIRIQFGPKTSFGNPKPPNTSDRKKSNTEVADEDIGETIIVKYNLLIGSSFFLRDFIIVGKIK